MHYSLLSPDQRHLHLCWLSRFVGRPERDEMVLIDLCRGPLGPQNENATCQAHTNQKQNARET